MIRSCPRWVVLAVVIATFTVTPMVVSADDLSPQGRAVQWAISHDRPLEPEVLGTIEDAIRRAEAMQPEISQSVIEQRIEQALQLRFGDSAPAGRRLRANTNALTRMSNSVAPVSVSYISPNRGTTAGGNVVYISGMSFEPGLTVTFGSVAATNVTLIYCTYMSMTVPAAAAVGPVNVTITNPDSTGTTVTNGYTYNVNAPMTVSSVSPPSGPTSGGTSVTINGTGFASDALVYFISRSGVTIRAASVTFVNSTTLTAATPPGAAGTAAVYVYSTSAGTSVTQSGVFTYTGADFVPPIIAGFTTAAAPGAPITIVGSNFIGVIGVYFAGQAASYGYQNRASAGYTVNSSTQITATVPNGAVSGQLQVETVFGGGASCSFFTPLASGPPTITSVSPTATYSTPNIFGTVINVVGTNFVDVREVLIGNNQPLSFYASPTNIGISPYPNDVAGGQITVITASGSVTSSGSVSIGPPAFCNGPAPTVSSISSPSAQRGTSLMFTGTNFGPPAAGMSMYAFLSWPGSSDLPWAHSGPSGGTSFSSVIPGDSQAGPITVVTNYGTATTPMFTPTSVGMPSVTGMVPSAAFRTNAERYTGTNLAGIFKAMMPNGLEVRVYSQGTSPSFYIPFSASDGTIMLTSLDGGTTAPLSLSCGAPVITGFTPPSAKGLQYISIQGSNFPAYPAISPVVFFNGARSSSTYVSTSIPTTVRVLVPADATTGPVTMGTIYGSTTSAMNFVIAGNADFNGDGKTDIVLRNYATGQDALWLMNGTTLSSTVDLPALANLNYRFEGTADFNADGKTDIVLRNYATGQDALWLMNGTTLSLIVDLPALTNISYHFSGTADFNADGKPDIILRNVVTGQNAVWLMNGTAVSTIVDLPALADIAWRIESAGDFNGDGKPDIVLRNYSTGQNALWLMNGTSLSSIVDLPALTNTAYHFVAVGDFNADGKPDIVLRNFSTGQNAVWLMNGTTLSSVVDLPALANTNYEINGPR